MEKLLLFNHFHNGDVFYSRVLIEKLKHHFDICYYHKMKPFLFEDFQGMKEIVNIPHQFEHDKTYFTNKHVNTWIGQQNFIYLNKINPGCTWENYNELSNDILNNLGLKKVDTSEHFLPKIYFENLKNYSSINKKMIELKNSFEKLILISNGDVESGQAYNFNFEPVIDKLSNMFDNYLFFTTQKINLNRNNIINTLEITKNLPDLLDIGFLSTFCDTIIGRASGPYCFSQNESNLLDEKKTFICFSYNYDEGKYYGNMKSKFVWSDTKDTNEVINTIINANG
jgi:hypothetical protein